MRTFQEELGKVMFSDPPPPGDFDGFLISALAVGLVMYLLLKWTGVQ